MRIFASTLLTLAFLNNTAFAADDDVSPEHTTPVNVSNHDVNRLSCALPIESVTYSKEKPVDVEVKDGNNVMVKFKILRQGTAETFATVPLDMFISCGGETYSVILYPTNRDATTIRLGSRQLDRVREIAKQWGALPQEERVERLTLCVFRHDCRDGFAEKEIAAKDPRKSIGIFKDVDVQGLYEVSAPGTGLKAVEYKVVVHRASVLNERDFLDSAFGDIAGITIDPLVVAKDGAARLIVVERSVDNAN